MKTEGICLLVFAASRARLGSGPKIIRHSGISRKAPGDIESIRKAGRKRKALASNLKARHFRRKE
jgi:hypothetical protein